MEKHEQLGFQLEQREEAIQDRRTQEETIVAVKEKRCLSTSNVESPTCVCV